ncbi:MAG: ribosome biogenesis GTPase Der [Clostridia bacterium]|nr:ribosome biogenesis GTPase Der [Clostridia bacterium]MBR2391414.1 ribosome biogenesis GTPase Der [Clostridia bacterium]
MKEPLVAIVGRPNVGKSTLFNRIVGKRISIVNDEPGVTRDRIFAHAEWLENKFTLIDTGGLDFEKDDEISTNIVKQAKLAIEMADVTLFVVDGMTGLTASDHDVVRILRKSKKKIILVVNKIDNYDPNIMYDYYELGLGTPYLVSSVHGKGMGDLLDKVVSCFNKDALKVDDDETIKIAIVGKPNAGKSSLINRLVGEERVIVSGVAGTTRDSVDIPFKYNKKKYSLIDTAGMRRKSKIEDSTVERYSIIRTLDSIRNADIVLLVIDVTEGVSDQDLKIAGFINEQNKPSIIILNKWDLVEKETNTMKKFEENLAVELAFMPYFKSVYLSAKTGQRTEKLMPVVEKVYENAHRKISAGSLNDVLQDAYSINAPTYKKNKKLRIFYATQTGVCPPTIVLFVNDIHLMQDNYLRYLENSIRKAFDFAGTPIRITMKCKKEEDL